MLLDRPRVAITGVIDWADIALDDPAVDIGSLAMWLGEVFAPSVVNAYGPSDEPVSPALAARSRSCATERQVSGNDVARMIWSRID
jgi:hypothetical protein